MIQSHEVPEEVVEVGSVRKYRINVKEKMIEDRVYYEFDEIEFNAVVPKEVTDSKIVKVYEELATAEVKTAIATAIDTMRVEVDGVGYDGDETSQDRMNRAIQTLVGDETIQWRMYDNSTEVVTQTELGKALRQAGVMMTRLWFCSSVEEVEAIVAEDAIWQAKYEGE